MTRHRFLVPILTAAVAMATAPVFATDEINTSPGLTAAGVPLALHGFDPVAYFVEGTPRQGRADLAEVHGGVTYYFASASNRDAFATDPARYVPAYGGFCAYGVSVGRKFDGDPRFWTISGGRLYLNLNADIEEKFQEDVTGSIDKADAQWQKIEHAAVADL